MTINDSSKTKCVKIEKKEKKKKDHKHVSEAQNVNADLDNRAGAYSMNCYYKKE